VFPSIFDNSSEDSAMLTDLHLITTIVIAVAKQPVIANFAVKLGSRVNFANNRLAHRLSINS
jgi:hypothetical protein